jgi:N-acetylglutamate synthase-like GNAT family acetyltransferase
MNPSSYRVRRATLDDVEQLLALWTSMRFAADDLARRITEFQVAEAPDGTLAGAVGLQLLGRQARIHSEGFTDFALAEQLRPMLWERLNAVAINHGLLRLWTQEQAPFWQHCGMVKPDAEALEKLPPPWQESTLPWMTIKLKEDINEVISADKEFAVFMEAEKQRTRRTLRRARALKFVATAIAVCLFFLVIAGALLLLRRNPHLLRR